MGIRPDKLQDILADLSRDYQQAFRNDLISLMLYGSAASGSLVKGKSDINILVVLTPEGMERLEDGFPLVEKWRKRDVTVPLVMTKKFIASSLDSYPIEFLNMKNRSALIYGENVLEPLDIRPEDLRLQIERELHSKILGAFVQFHHFCLLVLVYVRSNHLHVISYSKLD